MELRPSNGQARSNPKVRLADKLDLTAARTFCASIDQTFMALVSWSMATTDPVLIDLPMPIRTPRLTIRPKQVGDGAIAFSAVQCDTGFWVRKSAQGQGIATETANAMVCYAFGALGMQRRGFTHSLGNEPSRRIAERLGFALEGIQQKANLLPGGKAVDRYCDARFDVTGLPELEVTWEGR